MLAHISAHDSTMAMPLVVLCAWKAKCVTVSAQHKQAPKYATLQCHDIVRQYMITCQQSL